MLPLLHLGPLTIQTPGLIILLSIWVGLSVSDRYAKRVEIDSSRLDNLVLIVLLSGVLSARLAFAARSWSAFAGRPLDVFSLNLTMFDPIAGLVIGLLAGAVYLQKKQMPAWQTLDALTPGLAVFMVGLGLAHLASGDAFGAATNLPWGIDLWGEKRHPSQIYEAIAALLVLVAVWPRASQKERPLPPGTRFLGFAALTALARLFLEAFRGDSTLLPGGIRAAQVGAWLILAAAFYFLKHRYDQNMDRRE